MRVLVTGATGYVGGRLIPELLRDGHTVRVLVRSEERIRYHQWFDRVEVRVGDLSDPASLVGIDEGIDAAFYLVHSLEAGADFAAHDRRLAENFATAAPNLQKVIYLGGPLPEGASEHLRSRAEVGRILRERLPTTELRAGPIIGSGSASFEMVRYLTERLPIMITPKWVDNEVRPISIADVLAYLRGALALPPLGIVDIGGDVLTFRQMMEEYAAARGLRRTIIPVPVLAPSLAALWVGLVTPIPSSLAVPLIEGIVTPVRADTSRSHVLFPTITPKSYRAAVADAIRRTWNDEVDTRWTGALRVGSAPGFTEHEGVLREVRARVVGAPPERVFRTLTSLGGDRGWLAWNGAWRIRGWIDRVAGGPGLRRGRRHPSELRPGEAVDFWRVERMVPDSLLRLRAEMRVPGAAWLQWEITPDPRGSLVTQTALFVPTGVLGRLYWYSLYPIHALIFSDLVNAIGTEAERAEEGKSESVPLWV